MEAKLLGHWDNFRWLQINGEYPETQAAPQNSRQGQSERIVNSEKCSDRIQDSL